MGPVQRRRQQPEFANASYAAQLPEGAAPGTSVLRVQARSAVPVTYALGPGPFAIHPTSGEPHSLVRGTPLPSGSTFLAGNPFGTMLTQLLRDYSGTLFNRTRQESAY